VIGVPKSQKNSPLIVEGYALWICKMLLHLDKKARKTTAVRNIAERIHSIYAEPGGLCAMMTLFNDGATNTTP